MNKYYKQIEAWDWGKIIKEAKSNPVKDYPNILHGYAFLGTVFSLFPSGKYYTPFACANITEEEAEEDELYSEALETLAGKHGGWIDPGEGDPCDIFFVISMEDIC